MASRSVPYESQCARSLLVMIGWTLSVTKHIQIAQNNLQRPSSPNWPTLRTGQDGSRPGGVATVLGNGGGNETLRDQARRLRQSGRHRCQQSY